MLSTPWYQMSTSGDDAHLNIMDNITRSLFPKHLSHTRNLPELSQSRKIGLNLTAFTNSILSRPAGSSGSMFFSISSWMMKNLIASYLDVHSIYVIEWFPVGDTEPPLNFELDFRNDWDHKNRI